MKKTIFIFIIFLTFRAQAQNIFPVKLENCKIARFCLDCGNIKAGYDGQAFLKLQKKLNKELNLLGLEGMIKFQILVDSNGRGCVLSHSDRSRNSISSIITEELNGFKKWTPAITNGNNESLTSITIIFKINDNKISGQVERVDMDAFKKNFDKPQNPVITNEKYDYNNESLENYKITVWNSRNSSIPNNMNDNITIDKNGLIWVSVDDGLVNFDGEEFIHANPNVGDTVRFSGNYALATDNNNTKWVYGGERIYSFSNEKWKRHDSTETGINSAFSIINNQKTNEVFFCSNKGLTIYTNGIWKTLNKTVHKELPSNRVYFAKRDSKNRIWIGTFDGTAMIDENNRVTNFENTTSILKGKCITSMDEDENGNLFFTLYEFGRKEGTKVTDNDGIAIRSADGTFRHLTTHNSGLPNNRTNCIVYDKNEHVLWISTDRAGLVRYNLKNEWENYHNQNSAIPTSYISKMAFDNEGHLYLATRQGLVKIEKR